MTVRHFILLIASTLGVTAAGCGGGSGSLPATVVGASHSGLPAAHRKSKLGLRDEPFGSCPAEAVFLRLPGEIRGYPLNASGATSPCADILGAQTLLTGNGNGYGAIATSVHGNLHALAFQDNGNGGLLVYLPDAAGNATPVRGVSVDQDHVALAVDSQVNDYVVASQNYAGDSCWYVVPSTMLVPSTSNCDSNVGSVRALAVTPHDELVVLGQDSTTNATRIDIFANAASAAPTLVRSIMGAATGLPTGSLDYFALNYSVATDPIVGTLYVFSSDGVTAPKVSEFDAAATGNVAPQRTLSGPLTQLPSSSFAINVISVDRSSNLYVNSTGVAAPQIVISVFAPGASANAAPTRTIFDDTLLTPSLGGIAVRTLDTQASPGPTTL